MEIDLKELEAEVRGHVERLTDDLSPVFKKYTDELGQKAMPVILIVASKSMAYAICNSPAMLREDMHFHASAYAKKLIEAFEINGSNGRKEAKDGNSNDNDC